MHLIEIPAVNKKRYLPEDLSECNKAQYINLCHLLFRYQTGQITLTDFTTHGTYYLLDIKQTDKKRTEAIENEMYSNIAMVSELLLSFFEEIEHQGKKQLQIKQYYTHNHIPSFRAAVCKYYGPSDEFNNMTFGEYIDALDPYEDFHETGEVEYLYRLLAIFYRKKKVLHFLRKGLNNYDGNIRQVYNPNQVALRAKKFKHQHFGIVYGFYLFFASFQKYLTTVKIYMQGKEIDFSILFDDSLGKKRKESNVPGIGMRSLLHTMAESNVFGDMQKVRKANFWDIFINLYDLRKRDLDAQANEPKKQ